MLFAATAVAAILIPRVSSFPATDECAYLTAAERIGSGQIIYKDFFQFLPPGFFYVLAALMKFAGAGLPGARLFMIFCFGVHAGLLYVIARRFVALPLGAAAFAGLFLVCQAEHRYVLSHHFLSLPLADATLLCLLWHLDGRRFAIWAAALCTALCLAVTQTHGGLAFASAVASIAITRPGKSGRWKREIAVLFSICLVFSAAIAAYLAFNGALVAGCRDAIGWVFTHYRRFDSSSPYNGGWSALSRAFQSSLTSPDGLICLCTSVFVGYAQIAGLAVVAFGILFSRSRLLLDSAGRGSYICLLIFGAADWAGCFSFPNAFLIEQTSTLGYLCLYAMALQAAHLLFQRHRKAGLVLLCLCGLIVSLSAVRAVRHQIKENGRTERVWFDGRRERLWTTPGEYPTQISLLQFLSRSLAPGEPLFVLNWSPWIYYLSGHPNPTRYDGFWPVYNSDEQVEEVLASLRRARPRFIVRDNLLELLRRRGDPRFANLPPDVVARWGPFAYLESDYRPAQQFGPYRVFERRDPAAAPDGR